MGLAGVLLALAALVWLSFRGWSVLLLAPGAALVAAAANGEPLLEHWSGTFMEAAGDFVARFFPLFLLGALFGKLMEDSGAVAAIARLMTERLGAQRAVLAVVLAGALVTYGGVSLFVAFFVLAPMAQGLFRAADIPARLMPAAIVLGSSTFTMTALPGTPAIQNAIPMPFFGTTAFAAPGLGIVAAAIMLGFGLWWLSRAQAAARLGGEGYGKGRVAPEAAAADPLVRERATAAATFDPLEACRGRISGELPGTWVAMLPFAVVIGVNGALSFAGLPGVQAVVVALACAIGAVVLLNRRRLRSLRETMDAGASASLLPIISVASLVGFGAVVAAMPAFALVSGAVASLGGGPLVSLAVSTNVLAALTGSASGGMTIALDALAGPTLEAAARQGIDPALLHRVAAMAAGTLDTLPHNGAVVTLLAVCGATHRESYPAIVATGIVGPLLALGAVLVLGSAFGSF
jgi:H+/gluconate symporter-like permease